MASSTLIKILLALSLLLGSLHVASGRAGDHVGDDISVRITDSTKFYVPRKEYMFNAIVKLEEKAEELEFYINGKPYSFKKNDRHDFNSQGQVRLEIKHLPVIVTDSDHIVLTIRLLNSHGQIWERNDTLPYKLQQMNVLCIGERGRKEDDNVMWNCVTNDVNAFNSKLTDIGQLFFEINSQKYIDSSSVYLSRQLAGSMRNDVDKYSVDTDNDTYVLYLSGHGSGKVDDSKYHYSFLCSSDGPVAVNENTIFNFAKERALKGNKVWLFVDTCYSGYLTQYFSNRSAELSSLREGVGGIGIFTSTSSNTADNQYSEPDGDNSKFTTFLLETMSDSKVDITPEFIDDAMKEHYARGKYKKEHYDTEGYGCFFNRSVDAPFLSSKTTDIISSKKYPFSIYLISSLEGQYQLLSAGYTIDSESAFSKMHFSLGCKLFQENVPQVIPNLNKDLYMIGLCDNKISPAFGCGYNFGAFLASCVLSYQYAACKGDVIEYDKDGNRIETNDPFRLLNLYEVTTTETGPSIKSGVLSVSPSISFNFNYFTRRKFFKHLSVIAGYDFYIDTDNNFCFRDLNSSLNQNWHMGLGYNFSARR